MASIRTHHNGKLFFDFRYQGVRYREFTSLEDTPANRRKLQKILKRMEAEIALGQFDYAYYFPNSKNAARFREQDRQQRGLHPLFKDFAETWFEEFQISWRESTATVYRRYLDTRLIPWFGEKVVSDITKADILRFRTNVAKQSHGKLKAKTINKYVKCLNMILSEAADRFDFTPPHLSIKPLKEEKVHVEPFSLEEVNQILANVRPDWKDYLVVRFFTGLRTAEIDGLKWKYVDLSHRQILVRETYSQGRWTTTKNDFSQREVNMSTLVFETLSRRYRQLQPNGDDLVFPSNNGEPINVSNFLNRVWKPLLRHLGIKYRKPYQMRHTAATLWLASGENPAWIARQLGHSNTNMLFTVYARFVPNLTRRDGSAMDTLLLSQIQLNEPSNTPPKREEAESHADSEHGNKPGREERNHWDQILANMA